MLYKLINFNKNLLLLCVAMCVVCVQCSYVITSPYQLFIIIKKYTQLLDFGGSTDETRLVHGLLMHSPGIF